MISPDDRASAIDEKVSEYIEAGSRAVWTLDPRRRTLTVHLPGGKARRLGPDDTVEGGDALPGFTARVADFFV